ncbi:MAG: hypothetical protein ABFD82_03785 [Syntrophaceae bacterium]
MKTFKEINFSPFATNVLNCLGSDDLVTANGVKAKISQYGSDFIVTIGDTVYDGLSNIDASYVLNMNGVGRCYNA